MPKIYRLKYLKFQFEKNFYKSLSLLLGINKLIRLGTGAIEIKSGYGLNVESEIKILKVIRRLKESTPITIKSTFLGAHAIPKEFKTSKEYLDQVINLMIPKIIEKDLIDFIDIFCEKVILILKTLKEY